MPRVAGPSQWTSPPNWETLSGNLYQAFCELILYSRIYIDNKTRPRSRKVTKDNLRNTCRYFHVLVLFPFPHFQNLPESNFIKHLPFIQYGSHSSMHRPWIAPWILIWLGRGRRNRKYLRQSPLGRIYCGVFNTVSIRFQYDMVLGHIFGPFLRSWEVFNEGGYCGQNYICCT